MTTIPHNIITGLIITYNEEDNIRRVVDRLHWLQKIIVVDSFSTDATLSILASYPNVVVYKRKFDSFAAQCNYGLALADSEWILSLDSDYLLTEKFSKEVLLLINQNDHKVAYFCRFRFLVFGKQLLNDNTTPRAVFFKKESCIYYDDGHAHRLQINGDTGNFRNRILHDDRKSLSRWLNSQSKYSIQETDKLLSTPNGQLSFLSKIRKTKLLAPFFVFFYCLFVQGLIFNGWRGWHYTLQRTMVEMLFALRLIERKFEETPNQG